MEKKDNVDIVRKLIPMLSVFLLSIVFISNAYIGIVNELSFDESYYWMFSKFLSFGYFDHPPMVAWSIAIGTFIFGDNELGVRFMSNVYLLGTYLILLNMLKKKVSDINLAVLFLSMPLVVMSGMVALPDTPLMFFSTLFFYYLKKYLYHDSMRNSVYLSLSIAAMFYSKYHGLLIVLLSVGAHLPFLKRKSFWAIVALVILLFLPHMYWQYQHDFISFRFHLFGRVEKHFSTNNILNYVFSQFILMGVLFSALFITIFYKNKFKEPFERILIFNSFGFLVFLFLMSFRNQIEANWTISCSIAFIILMCKFVERYQKFFIIAGTINILLFIFVRVILLSPSRFIEPTEENRLNEIWGWKERIKKIQDICDGQKLVGDNYQISAKLAFYTHDPTISSLHFGSRESHYSILNLDKNIGKHDTICYLTSKNIMNATRVETGYKDPVYVIPGTSLDIIAKFYRTSYEDVIRE